jgi:hypothetical protein
MLEMIRTICENVQYLRVYSLAVITGKNLNRKLGRYSSFQNYRVHLKNQEADLLQFFPHVKMPF